MVVFFFFLYSSLEGGYAIVQNAFVVATTSLKKPELFARVLSQMVCKWVDALNTTE
jgi:hypothetical protein